MRGRGTRSQCAGWPEIACSWACSFQLDDSTFPTGILVVHRRDDCMTRIKPPLDAKVPRGTVANFGRQFFQPCLTINTRRDASFHGATNWRLRRPTPAERSDLPYPR